MADGSFYERVGGRATFEQLVREFYKGVASDPPLRRYIRRRTSAPPKSV